VENNNVLENEADSSFNLFRDVEDIDDEYSYDYDDYVDDSMWGDEDWKEAGHQNLHRPPAISQSFHSFYRIIRPS
jgi:hypothetical protein